MTDERSPRNLDRRYARTRYLYISSGTRRWFLLEWPDGEEFNLGDPAPALKVGTFRCWGTILEVLVELAARHGNKQAGQMLGISSSAVAMYKADRRTPLLRNDTWAKIVQALIDDPERMT